MCDILFEINAFCEINTNYDTCTLTLMYIDLSTCIQTFQRQTRYCSIANKWSQSVLERTL